MEYKLLLQILFIVVMVILLIQYICYIARPLLFLYLFNLFLNISSALLISATNFSHSSNLKAQLADTSAEAIKIPTSSSSTSAPILKNSLFQSLLKEPFSLLSLLLSFIYQGNFQTFLIIFLPIYLFLALRAIFLGSPVESFSTSLAKRASL